MKKVFGFCLVFLFLLTVIVYSQEAWWLDPNAVSFNGQDVTNTLWEVRMHVYSNSIVITFKYGNGTEEIIEIFNKEDFLQRRDVAITSSRVRRTGWVAIVADGPNRLIVSLYDNNDTQVAHIDFRKYK